MMVIGTLTGCNNGRAYDRYRALDIEGWDRSDTVDFNASRLTPGTYDMYVGFRATSSYPFRIWASTSTGPSIRRERASTKLSDATSSTATGT